MGIDRRTMLGACAAALSVAGAYGTMRVLTAGNMPHAAHDNVAARGAAGKADKYTCPMHPDVVKDGPGSCPICGMHLVKLADSGASGNTQLVHVDQQTQERMGVRVAAATESDMHRAVAGFAAISADESRAVSVNPKVEGWIRRMVVRGPGQAVRKGQLLYEIYSPELQQRQREYLDLLARREALLENSNGMGASNSAMLGSLAKERFRARDRLLAADMPPESVAALEKDRRVIDVVPVRAAHNGVVTAVSAREGSYVNPMQQILAYADTGSAWAEVTVFPDQLAWIRNGDVIVLTSPLDKSRTAQARVDLSALQVDPATRTAKLRLALSNTRGDFPPGTLAEASIRTGARRALTVPRDAVIRTGHGDFVVVSEGNGHFRSVKVATGAENNDAVEILKGIGRGTAVAVNGQFLLDAAASMQAMQGRMAANAARPRLDEHAAHRHHGKTHGGGHSS